MTDVRKPQVCRAVSFGVATAVTQHLAAFYTPAHARTRTDQMSGELTQHPFTTHLHLGAPKARTRLAYRSVVLSALKALVLTETSQSLEGFKM